MARLLWTIIENRKREWMARLDRLGKLLTSRH
jgi:hypothetical protein